MAGRRWQYQIKAETPRVSTPTVPSVDSWMGSQPPAPSRAKARLATAILAGSVFFTAVTAPPLSAWTGITSVQPNRKTAPARTPTALTGAVSFVYAPPAGAETILADKWQPQRPDRLNPKKTISRAYLYTQPSFVRLAETIRADKWAPQYPAQIFRKKRQPVAMQTVSMWETIYIEPIDYRRVILSILMERPFVAFRMSAPGASFTTRQPSATVTMKAPGVSFSMSKPQADIRSV